jgi:hypothetical protein
MALLGGGSRGRFPLVTNPDLTRPGYDIGRRNLANRLKTFLLTRWKGYYVYMTHVFQVLSNKVFQITGGPHAPWVRHWTLKLGPRNLDITLNTLQLILFSCNKWIPNALVEKLKTNGIIRRRE